MSVTGGCVFQGQESPRGLQNTLPHVILFKPHNHPIEVAIVFSPFYLDFTDGKTEAQRGAETGSHSKEQAELGFWPKPGALFLTPQYSPLQVFVFHSAVKYQWWSCSGC